MTMDDDLTLFDATPVARLQKGDRVLVQTMWGQETGVVWEVHDEDGWPMVTVTLEMGDTASFDVAWVRPEGSA